MEREGRSWFQSVADVRTYGAMVAYSIKRWKIAEKSIVIGHGMGAQVIGEAARWLKKNDGDPIDHCIGLDPAAPGFDNTKKDRR